MSSPATTPPQSSSSLTTADLAAAAPPPPAVIGRVEAAHPRDLTPEQWKCGIAAWLGWFFDGLDMHLYTIVAGPVVALLLHTGEGDALVKTRSAYIQAAFLIGWALGGAFFGRVGDLLGRSRSLALSIFTYAGFTGISFFAGTWWQLLICRFIAALGIGGEWAVGSSLLSETWPRKWRHWIAAVLQTGVNLGVIGACATGYLMAPLHDKRYVFLVGVIPALIVFWIRRNVPEPAEWHAARADAAGVAPRVAELFAGPTRRITLLTVGVCACSLTGWWGFMFWINQHWKRLPEVAAWPAADQDRFVSLTFLAIIGISIAGNFFAGSLAKRFGYRRGIALMCLGMFASMFGGFIVPRDHVSLLPWALATGFFSGLFGLFTMYLPPLFPVLLRTTGAGFSYNIGRIAAAAGTIVFAVLANVKDFRPALLVMGFLLLPAAAIAWVMPELADVEAAAAAASGASIPSPGTPGEG
jgi:MFS family permease